MDDPSSIKTDELEGDLPDEARGQIKAELAPGERLLWAAGSRPTHLKSGVVGRVVSALISAGLFLFGGVCLAAYFGRFGLRATESSIPVVIGAGSGLIGFFFIIGIFASWGEMRAERTRIANRLYALTDRRALIWVPLWDHPSAFKVHTIPRGKIGNVHRVQYPDGSGDLIFQDSKTYKGEEVGFLAILDVRHVEELVRRALVAPDAADS